MTEAQQRTQIRNALLLDLEAASPASLPVSTLAAALTQVHVIRCDSDALDKHLDHLLGKGLVAVRGSAISAGDLRYSLTSSGRDYLEESGLI
jgi:hypothetical protein